MLLTPNQACFYTRAWIDLRNLLFCFKNPSFGFMETKVAMFQKPIFCLQEDNLHGDISWFQEPIFVFHGGKSCLQGAMFQKPIFCLQEDNLHGDISWFLGANFWLQGTWLHGDNFWFHGDNFWFKGNISLL